MAACSRRGGGHTAHVHPSGMEGQMNRRLCPEPGNSAPVQCLWNMQDCPCWMLVPQPGERALVNVFCKHVMR